MALVFLAPALSAFTGLAVACSYYKNKERDESDTNNNEEAVLKQKCLRRVNEIYFACQSSANNKSQNCELEKMERVKKLCT